MRLMVSTRRSAVLVLALALTTACGTTTHPQSSTTAAPDGLAGSGSTSPYSPGAGRAGTTLPGPAATAGGPVGAAGGATRPAGPVTTPPRQHGRGLVPARGPGVDDKYLYIGLLYSPDTNAANTAVGAAGASSSYDSRQVYQAVFDYANAHGGFAGRKIKAVWHKVTPNQDASTQAQAACDDWTKDHKVFVVSAGNEILDRCAEDAHAVSLGSGTADTFKRYPHMVAPGAIALDRLGVVTVNGLARANYFSGKLGLVTWDDREYRRSMTAGYLPTLAKHGIKPTQTVYITVPQQLGALGESSAAVSNAITKFRSLGIDHVIIQDGPAGVFSGTGLTFEWMNQAKSQRYYPRYGQNLYNSPGWAALPADQMNHAIAIDQADYDARMDEGYHLNAAREKCFQIQRAAGLPVSSANAQDEANAAGTCDIVFFIQRAVNLLSVIDADAFVQALPQIGSSLGSAAVYGTKWVPGRRDSGSKVRPEEYLASCRCMRYVGPPYDAS